ncbi:hypothetical protein [Rubrivivax gelatinosus]|uniref:Uncharacterized protein n=1 Tax=Rubrivivax gelatinosus TaxID=28068 RepID=A0A4R2MGW7_RUBGE|nr:hypothetical protein [Rubrivivax gelatinosus]TCP05721.1 hypothetical protein EV684_101595 [Rubrivivax gelatinosus]
MASVQRVQRHYVTAWGIGFRLGLLYGVAGGGAVMAAVFQVALLWPAR